MTRNQARLLDIILSVLALGLITTANRLGSTIIRAAVGARVLWLAEVCIPSLLVCLLVYLAIGPARPFGPVQPGADRRSIMRLALTWIVVWLMASAAGAVFAGHWIRYTDGCLALICFVVVGPAQEEMLFRGALFELIERGWPNIGKWGPVVGTAVPFAFQHFQFHGYRPSPAAVLQVGFTFPMGLVFARLRQMSGSVWPGFVVHIVTNLMGAFGSSV